MNQTSFKTDQIDVRRIKKSDLPRLLTMIKALAAFNSDQSTTTLDDLHRDLLGPSPWLIVFVATVEDSLIGYAALCPLAQLQFGHRGLDIHHLFVEEPYRARGIGKKLIATSLQEAKRLGCAFIKIGTSAQNHIAQKAYLAAGFELEGSRGPRFKLELQRA